MNILVSIFKIIIAIATSAALTYLCVIYRIDWEIACYFEQRPYYIVAAIPGVILGMIVPILIILLYISKAKKTTQKKDWMIVRKLVLAFVYAIGLSTLLKALTNRVDMEPFQALGKEDFSDFFRFGFLKGKNLWESLSEGWPSGHTFIASVFFVVLKPHLSKKYNWYHITYVLLIMLSVLTSFHWFSDVLSGFILGIILGNIIVKMYKKYESNN